MTDSSHILGHVMVALDTVVLEYEGDGRVKSIGPYPAWYETFASMVGCDDPSQSVKVSDGFPYLDFFLIDAEVYWNAGGGEPLSSGIWYETCEEFGGECHLEAQALFVDGRRLLLIEKMGARFEEQRDLIQAARDSHLEHDRELSKQQRVAEVLRVARHELERRVAERTAALTAANRNLHDEIIEHQRTAQRLLAYQQKLKRAALRLATAEEDERRRIATALHDQIGQMLAISKIRLNTAKMLEKDAAVTEQLDDVEGFIDEVIAYTRSLTFELGSPILYELGLQAALESMVEQAAAQNDLTVTLQPQGPFPPLEEAINVVLFQAVHEAIFNACKYAEANTVSVETETTEDTFRIHVIDDGKGFDPAAVSPDTATRSGFGLFNIRERMESIGGQLIIDSGPGKGTRITLETPLSAVD